MDNTFWSEYPDNGLPADRSAPGLAGIRAIAESRRTADLSEAIAKLEAAAAAVAGDFSVPRGVSAWWSWRLQRSAEYLERQLILELLLKRGTHVSAGELRSS